MQSITETGIGTKPGSSPVADVEFGSHDAPAELQDLLHALRAMRNGDFSVRMSVSMIGDRDVLLGKIADTFNEIAAANERMAQQLDRVETVVGREGVNPAADQARADNWRVGRNRNRPSTR